MATLQVEFVGEPPFVVRVLEARPLRGFPAPEELPDPLISQRERILRLELPPAVYRLDLRAARAREPRWVAVEPGGARVQTRPVSSRFATRRDGRLVESWGPDKPRDEVFGVLLAPGASLPDDLLADLQLVPVEVDAPDDRRLGLSGALLRFAKPGGVIDPRAQAAQVLAALRAHPAIAAAGPAHRRGADFSLLKARLHVQFRAGTSDAEIGFLLAQVRPIAVTRSRLAPRRYIVELRPGTGRAVSALAERLARDPRVQVVEPGFGERPVVHAPTDLLGPLLWDRALLRIPEAVDVVDPASTATVRVLDVGFTGFEGSPEFDASGANSVNDNSRHGVYCMGLIAAAADADGTFGASPGGPLIAIVYPSFGAFEMGLGPETVPLDADVFSGSLGITGVLPSAMLALSQAATRLGRGGRGLPQFYSAGDKTPASTVAGNSFGASEFGFTTAAFMLDESQAELDDPNGADPAAGQIKLPAGNTGPEVDWATPGPDTSGRRVWTTDAIVDGELPIDASLTVTVVAVTDPALGKYQVTGPRPTVVSFCNKAIRQPILPNIDPTSASMSIQAVNAVLGQSDTYDVELGSVSTALSPGDALLLSAEDVGTVTVATVSSVDQLGVEWHPGADLGTGETTYVIGEGTSFRRQLRFDAATVSATELHDLLAGVPPEYAAQAGDTLVRPAQGAQRFGATSAANALAAGIGALALRANPQLTWLELREVLSASAMPIVGSGLSATAYAQAFGAGRLDALEAVEQAREYLHHRADLHIRDDLGDQGDGPTAPMSPSPDIWVRHFDPVRYVDPADPTPLVAGEVHLDYGVSDQHQAPIHGQTNFVHVRVRNRGARVSPVAWVMLYVASTHDDDLINWPGVRTSTDTSIVRAIGGPIQIGPMAPDEIQIVRFVWTAAEMLDAGAHPTPVLLAEITPQDGALAEAQVHRNTSLAMRPVTMDVGNGAGPELIWRDASDQPLGFATPPTAALIVRAHLPGGPAASAYFNAHGRARSDDSPQTLTVGAPTWSAAAGAYEFTVNVPVDCAELVLEAEVEDALGRPTPSAQRYHRMAVRLPIEVTLLLDRSGSMGAMAGSMTRWAAARRAALLFDGIFNVFKAPGDTLKAIGFSHTGGAYQWTGTTLAALPVAGPAGATPLGEAIRYGATDPAAGFSAGAAGERVLVLLTDGKHNRGPSLEDVRAPGSVDNPVSVIADPLQGVRVHACAFGAPGTVDTDALEGLVHGGDDPALTHFAGRLQSTETLDDADDAGALTEMFLSVVADVTGVEMIGPLSAANNTFVVEDGVDTFLLVAPAGPATLTLTGPSVATATSIAGVPGCVMFEVSGNTAGTWSLNGAPATDCFVLVDLQLTSDFAVEPTLDGGFDCAVTLLFAGQPIINARCELTARGPGEAIGEVIANAGLRARRARKADEVSVRGALLKGALARRGLKRLRVARNVHVLQPTGGGRYATSLDGPLRTGTWSFELKVTGETPSGQPFERLVRASRVIAARPDATTSAVRWTTLANGAHQVVVTPRDRRGDRLGPGLTLTTVANGAPHPLIDQGDGTYRARFDARQALRLSKRLGARAVPAPTPRMHHVRVVVERVHVRDSHDGRGAGEWVFVSRSQLGRRRKSTRLPREGVLSLRPNATVEPGSVLVDGGLTEGERLTLRLDAFELDGRAQWIKTLRPTGRGVNAVGRATLQLNGDPRRWAGAHRLTDAGWRVDLRVEIDKRGERPPR